MLDFYPKDYISISALQSFEQCPLNFFIHYYGGVEFGQGEKAELGSQFQLALNEFYGGGDVSKAIEQINPNHRLTAKQLIENAQKFDDIISIDSPYHVDLGFGKPFIFVPDLLTNKYVVENKYTTGYYNAEMAKTQKQGTLYYLGAYKALGLKNNVIYQIFNHKNRTHELVELQKNQKDVDALLFWIENKLKDMERCYLTGNWNHGSHGRFYCDLGKECPVRIACSAQKGA